MKEVNAFSKEVYELGINKLESRWRYVDHLLSDMREDDAFKQHQDLIEQLDYLKEGTNRIKLGIKGTEPAIEYPLRVNTLIDASEPKLQYNYSIQSSLFVLGSAIAELQEVINDLNDQYSLFVQEAEYHEHIYHWDLIDKWIREVG